HDQDRREVREARHGDTAQLPCGGVEIEGRTDPRPGLPQQRRVNGRGRRQPAGLRGDVRGVRVVVGGGFTGLGGGGVEGVGGAQAVRGLQAAGGVRVVGEVREVGGVRGGRVIGEVAGVRVVRGVGGCEAGGQRVVRQRLGGPSAVVRRAAR